MYEVVIAGVHIPVEHLMVDAAGMLAKGCINYLEFLVIIAIVGDRCAAENTLWN